VHRRFGQPLVATDLLHTDAHAKLLGQSASTASRFCSSCSRALGSDGIDADTAPAHLMHHRQQIDLEPIGRARAFLVEYWIEAPNSASVFAASASA
jgi:hypothetical protein